MLEYTSNFLIFQVLESVKSLSVATLVTAKTTGYSLRTMLFIAIGLLLWSKKNTWWMPKKNTLPGPKKKKKVTHTNISLDRI